MSEDTAPAGDEAMSDAEALGHIRESLGLPADSDNDYTLLWLDSYFREFAAPSRSVRAGTDDRRVDILAEALDAAFHYIDETNQEYARAGARTLLARLDAAAPSSAPTEGATS